MGSFGIAVKRRSRADLEIRNPKSKTNPNSLPVGKPARELLRANSEPVWSGPPRPRYCIEKSARFSVLIPGTHSPARSQSRNAR